MKNNNNKILPKNTVAIDINFQFLSKDFAHEIINKNNNKWFPCNCYCNKFLISLYSEKIVTITSFEDSLETGFYPIKLVNQFYSVAPKEYTAYLKVIPYRNCKIYNKIFVGFTYD